MERPKINVFIVAPDATVLAEVNRLCVDDRYEVRSTLVSSVQEIGDRGFDIFDVIICSVSAKKTIQQLFKIRNYMLFWVILPEAPGMEQNQELLEKTSRYFDNNQRVDLKNVLDQVYRVKREERQRLYECERSARSEVILSVHHHVNNALFPIFSSLTKLTRELGERPDEKLIQHIQMIEKNASKIKKFVSELK